MATAIQEPPATELDQVREIARQRRTLEQAAQNAREDYSDQQEKIGNLITRLADADDESVEAELVAARGRLRELSAIRDEAATELTEFASQHLTPEELARREARLAWQVQLAGQATARGAFADNVRRRLELLEDLKRLETEAAALYANCRKQWQHHIPGSDGERPLRTAAGIQQDLIEFVDNGFWQMNGKDVHGRFYGLKQRATAWLSQEIPN